MEDVYRQDTSHDVTMKASFQVFDKQGHSAKKEFIFRRIGSPGDSKNEVVFTGAEGDSRSGAALDQSAGRGNGSTLHAGDRAVRSVVPQERSARFIGTDFTFEDIGERVLGDFTYRLIGDTETLDGHKTYKIEATPVDAGRSQYKFIYFWVAQDVR